MTYENEAIENMKKEITNKYLDKVHALAYDAEYYLMYSVPFDLSSNRNWQRALHDLKKLSEMTSHDE